MPHLILNWDSAGAILGLRSTVAGVGSVSTTENTLYLHAHTENGLRLDLNTQVGTSVWNLVFVNHSKDNQILKPLGMKTDFDVDIAYIFILYIIS